MVRCIGQRWSVIGILLATVVASANALPAFASEVHRFDIPAQAASEAIDDFASQAHVQILVAGEKVEGKQLRALSGEYSTQEGLALLLADSGLAPKYVGERSIALVTASTEAASVVSEDNSSAMPNVEAEAKKSFWDRFRIAQANNSSTATPPQEPTAEDGSASKLEEIVVSAQKKVENLHDVPVPVTAINAEGLVNSNQLRLQDYYAKVPGLNVQVDPTTGVPSMSIRGITTGGQTNPTVGITVDDVPYGSSTFIGGGFVSPDIDPSELSRIEVLRGPQGTLYGVASIGGLLKYVTADPSTDEASARVQVGTSSVENGDELGYNVRGSANLPLSETAAMRVSAFTRRDPGYVDNVQPGDDGVNLGRTEGGRFALLWRPVEEITVKLSALLQHNDIHGSSVVDVAPGFGDLEQSFLTDTGGYEQRFQAYTANVTARLGGVDVTSISGYGVNKSSLSYDLTPAYGEFLTEPTFGVRGTPYFNDLKTTKWTQEIRLSAPLGQRAEWLAGAFYTHENSKYVSDVFAQDPAGGPYVGQMLHYINPTEFEEIAAFGNLTWHFTDRFDIQFGARQSEIKHADSAVGSGPLNGGDSITPETLAKENAFTYLVTPRFKFSPDVMAYARLASGYRSGGPNSNAAALGVPGHYEPDKTQNYDMGLKADVLDQALSIDASLYYIDWKDVQVTLLTPDGAAVFIVNAGRARSQGVELAVQTRPRRGLTIAAWAGWNNGELTDDFPTGASAFGNSGDRLPYSSRFSGSVSLDQKFSLASGVTVSLGAAVSYVGERRGNFASVFRDPPERQVFPSYARTDLYAGAAFRSWEFNLFANNVMDRRGVLTGGLDGPTPTSFIYIQPRTIGASVSKSF